MDKEFEHCYARHTPKEVFAEYLDFIRSIPGDLIETEKKRILKVFEDKLQIADIMKNIAKLDFKSLVNVKSSKLVDVLSINLGYSLKILCPPTKYCILCKKGLSIHHKPTQMIVHKISGPELYSKYLYRCRNCKLSKDTIEEGLSSESVQKDINYDVDKYGNMTTGWLFYKKYEPYFIKASNEVFLDKTLVESYSNNLCHAWMSMEGQSESYNQTWLGSEGVKYLNKFLSLNPEIGRHFNRTMSSRNTGLIVPNDVHEDESIDKLENYDRISSMAELGRKSLSSALLNFWIHKELQERKEVNKHFFGPYYSEDEVDGYIAYQKTVEQYLSYVEKCRISEIYEHKICTDQCKRRGCGAVWSADGLWKLSYPICMMNISGGISEDLQSYVPMVCSNSPAPLQAFCDVHCKEVSRLGYPTGLKEFLKSCSNSNQIVDPGQYCKPMKDGVDEELRAISKKLDETHSTSGAEAQGTSYFLRHTSFRNKANFQLEGQEDDACNKDTGSVMKLRRWSRGIFAIVRGG